MDLRTLPADLSPPERCNERRRRVEKELTLDLDHLVPIPVNVGHADEKNCEQMIGHVPIPVGVAGPLTIKLSNKKPITVHYPLATTEGALVASINRGCKAISESDGAVIKKSIYHGMTRSIAFKIQSPHLRQGYGGQAKSKIQTAIRDSLQQWKRVGESTSNHLKILNYSIDIAKPYLFLTIACDTDEAMGMNMTTIAAQAIADWIVANIEGLECVTIAGNVDSDKKPSARTHKLGRGYEIIAQTTLTDNVITSLLKTTPAAIIGVADAKLKAGSKLAGAIGANLHAANIIAALYLATGQDAAHVVEGSLTDTTVKRTKGGLIVSVRLPAILVGVRGGGTTLPAQSQCLTMLLNTKTGLHPSKQLAETIAAAVLAGEVSLLAAQASHNLAKAHKKLGR